MSPKHRVRLRLARERWAAWLGHAVECTPCRSLERVCVRGRSLHLAWQVARDLASEEEETPSPPAAAPAHVDDLG